MPGKNDEAKVLVQARLPKALVREIDHATVDEDMFRGEFVERLLRMGLEIYRQQVSMSLGERQAI